MKKIVPLILIIIVVAGCNKQKIYKENLAGVWHVYKYLWHNTDKTVQFQSQHPNYSIAFTEGGAFTEFMTNPDTSIVTGTYAFTDNDEKIVLTHVYYTFTTDTGSLGDSVNFVWDTTFYPHNFEREYTIFNLSKDHVQLRNDTSQLYMNKEQQ